MNEEGQTESRELSDLLLREIEAIEVTNLFAELRLECTRQQLDAAYAEMNAELSWSPIPSNLPRARSSRGSMNVSKDIGMDARHWIILHRGCGSTVARISDSRKGGLL